MVAAGGVREGVDRVAGVRSEFVGCLWVLNIWMEMVYVIGEVGNTSMERYLFPWIRIP